MTKVLFPEVVKEMLMERVKELIDEGRWLSISPHPRARQYEIKYVKDGCDCTEVIEELDEQMQTRLMILRMLKEKRDEQ